jgi:hypothetical protein
MTTVQTAGLARAVRALPSALQPTWLESAWAGRFGAGGLAADMRHIKSEVDLTAAGIHGQSSARGAIVRNGEDVGTITRYLHLHPSGRLEAQHSYLQIHGTHQGTGFARALNDHAWSKYADAGVDDVTVHAAVSVGGYAWARQGFEILSSGADDAAHKVSRAEKITRLVDTARRAGRIGDAAFQALEPRLFRGGKITADTLASVRELAAMPETGRAALLGQDWYGIRPIERTQAWWAGRAPGGYEAVQAGVSHLTQPENVRDASIAAARRISGQLPPALDAINVARVGERELGRVGGGASLNRGAQDVATHLDLGGGNEVLSAKSRVTYTTELGHRVVIGTRLDEMRGIVGYEDLPDAITSPTTSRSLNGIWRELGITRVEGLGGEFVREVRPKRSR